MDAKSFMQRQKDLNNEKRHNHPIVDPKLILQNNHLRARQSNFEPLWLGIIMIQIGL